MGKTAQEGVASHSSAHKQIAHGLHVHGPASDTQGEWQGTSYESDWIDHDDTHSCTCTTWSRRRAQADKQLLHPLFKLAAPPSAADNPMDPKRTGSQIRGDSTSSPGPRALQAAKANTAAPFSERHLWSKHRPHPWNAQHQGRRSGQRLALAMKLGKRDLEQLLKGAIGDQERNKSSWKAGTRVRVKWTKKTTGYLSGGTGS